MEGGEPLRYFFDLRKNWKQALGFSIPSVIFLYSYTVYSIKIKHTFLFENVSESFMNKFIWANYFIMLIALVLCIMIGFSWSRQYGLIGYKMISARDKVFWMSLGTGIVFMILGITVIDGYVFKDIPIFWPNDYLDCVMKQLRFPMILEIILRLGLVTLIYRLNKNIFRAIVYVAIFYTLGAIYNQIRYFDIAVKSNLWFLISGGYMFAINIAAGYFYYKGGIIYAMLFQFIFGLRYYWYL